MRRHAIRDRVSVVALSLFPVAVDTTTSGSTPGRSDVIPESYAVYVTPERGHVWQYRASPPKPAGRQDSVETLDRNADPKLPMAHTVGYNHVKIFDTPGCRNTLRDYSRQYHAPSMPPTPEGYCSYSRTYQCELDCE